MYHRLEIEEAEEERYKPARRLFWQILAGNVEEMRERPFMLKSKIINSVQYVQKGGHHTCLHARNILGVRLVLRNHEHSLRNYWRKWTYTGHVQELLENGLEFADKCLMNFITVKIVVAPSTLLQIISETLFHGRRTLWSQKKAVNLYIFSAVKF